MSVILIKATSIYLAGFLDIALGYFIYKKNSQKPKNISFFLFALSIGIWSITVASFYLTVSEPWGYFWLFFITFNLLFIPATFYHMVTALTSPSYEKEKKTVLFFYSIVILIILYPFLPKFFIAELSQSPGNKEMSLGLGYIIYSFIYGVIILLSFYRFHENIKLTKSDRGKININKYLFYSTAIAFTFGSIFNWLLILMGNFKFIWVGPLSLFIVIGTTAYLIFKRRFLSIRVIISRSLAFILMFIICSLFATIAFFIYSKIIFLRFDVLTICFLILLLFITGLTFHPLRLHLQTTPDKFLFRQKYLYEQAIKELGENCRSIVDLDKLLGLFRKKAKETVKSRDFRVYLCDKDGSYIRIK